MQAIWRRKCSLAHVSFPCTHLSFCLFLEMALWGWCVLSENSQPVMAFDQGSRIQDRTYRTVDLCPRKIRLQHMDPFRHHVVLYPCMCDSLSSEWEGRDNTGQLITWASAQGARWLQGSCLRPPIWGRLWLSCKTLSYLQKSLKTPSWGPQTSVLSEGLAELGSRPGSAMFLPCGLGKPFSFSKP